MQNALLQEAIAEVRAAGIEPGEILPIVKLNRSTRSYGRCHKVGNAFEIALSKYFLDNPPEDLKNTLVHEVLHTVTGCFNHGSKWKSLAAKMNRIYGYNIQRTTPDIMQSEEAQAIKKQYIINCLQCNQIIYRQRRSKLVTNTNNFRCGRCGGKLELAGD